MSNVAIYPGTFDPFTNGHLDLVTRGSKIFDRVVVAVASKTGKNIMFSLEERVAMIAESVEGIDGVEVESFGGLLIDYAREKKARSIIRGLRAVSDFEYELQLALMNRRLVKIAGARDIDTVFLMPSLKYIFLSSTIVKEAATFGGDVTGLVPKCVERALKEKFSGQV